MIELIRQHYNHPAVVCWGIFNEQSSTVRQYCRDQPGQRRAPGRSDAARDRAV